MLPRHERRRLEEIERQFTAEDPEFVRRLTQTRLLTQVLSWLSPRGIVAVVAAALSLMCLVLGEGAGFVTAGVLAAVLLTLRTWNLQAE
jgi:hypothetical protein